jgi:hypothetical protein
MKKDHKSLLEMLMTENKNESERSLEMWNEDPYPPNRLATLLGDNHRSAVINFIHSFQWRVEQGHAIPNHWLKFIARLLGGAVDAVESGDKRALDNPIAKAMNISGRENHFVRDQLIAHQVRRYHSQGDRLEDAIDRVQLELIERHTSLTRHTVKDIDRRRNKLLDHIVEDTLEYETWNFLDHM